MSDKSVATTVASSSVASSSRSGHKNKYPKKLFINIAPCTNEIQLRNLAMPFGRIMDVTIPKDKDGKNRGFVFVAFRWHEDAADALKGLEGYRVDNVIFHPRWASPSKKCPKKVNRKDQQRKDKKKIMGSESRQSKQVIK